MGVRVEGGSVAEDGVMVEVSNKDVRCAWPSLVARTVSRRK